MQKKLLLTHDEGAQDDAIESIINVRVTHKRASLSALESLAFADRLAVLNEISRLPGIDECLLLQTCNRVEVYAVMCVYASARMDNDIVNFWLLNKGLRHSDKIQLFEKSSGSEALLHLLKVGAGLESMVVGEDQILGQMREAFKESSRLGTVGPVLSRVFEYALRVGRVVRSTTAINEGAVSMGSAAIDLLKGTVGDLKEKRILIVGAGEAGELVGKALVSREAGIIFVANRTYTRAVEMARELGGKAIRFDAIEGHLVSVDAVVVATSAPHYVLTYTLMRRVMAKRGARRLVVVDLGEPRNVECTVARLPGLMLRDIDDLRGLAHSGIERRIREVHKAEKLVDQSLQNLIFMLKRDRIEPVISALCRKAEEIRRREAAKALARIGATADDLAGASQRNLRTIIDDFSKSLVEGLLHDQITYLRQSSADGDLETITTATKLLGVQMRRGNNGDAWKGRVALGHSDHPRTWLSHIGKEHEQQHDN